MVNMTGAKIDATNINGQTALHVACLRAEEDIVEILLAAGASCFAQNFQTDCPSHLAAKVRPPKNGVSTLQTNSHKKSNNDPVFLLFLYRVDLCLACKRSSTSPCRMAAWPFCNARANLAIQFCIMQSNTGVLR